MRAASSQPDNFHGLLLLDAFSATIQRHNDEFLSALAGCLVTELSGRQGARYTSSLLQPDITHPLRIIPDVPVCG